jgi:thiamine-monophosphate kinase
MIQEILENAIIDKIAGKFSRAPFQINKIHESDAEILSLGENCDISLAITTDALIEEVASGLYDNPYLMGWMLATVNFSDLAAVGADPLGLIIAIAYPESKDDEFSARLSQGISDACQEAHSYVIGGDTNQADSLYLCGCAVGTLPKQPLISRIGVKPGDSLYLSGTAGRGNAFAFSRLMANNFKTKPIEYKPSARLTEGKLIRQFASCCMDTSDGVIHTLDTLMRLNRVKFDILNNWNKIIDGSALDICALAGVPPWLMLAGIHGEFELCFTIDPDKEMPFLEQANQMDWSPIFLGKVNSGTGLFIETDKRSIFIDSTKIRNLSQIAGRDPLQYISALLEMSGELKL